MAIESTGEIDIVWRGVQAGASCPIGGLRDKMAGLAGNLLKLSYKNLTNATIYRYHVKYACI